MKIEKSGYGAGTRDFPGHANVVRLTIGESSVDSAGEDCARKPSRYWKPISTI